MDYPTAAELAQAQRDRVVEQIATIQRLAINSERKSATITCLQAELERASHRIAWLEHALRWALGDEHGPFDAPREPPLAPCPPDLRPVMLAAAKDCVSRSRT